MFSILLLKKTQTKWDTYKKKEKMKMLLSSLLEKIHTRKYTYRLKSDKQKCQGRNSHCSNQVCHILALMKLTIPAFPFYLPTPLLQGAVATPNRINRSFDLIEQNVVFKSIP